MSKDAGVIVPPLGESFLELKVAAKQLNDYSDQLSKPVAALDAALSRLNLGISAWTTTTKIADNGDSYHFREVGYAKIDRTWGIALREGTVDETGDLVDVDVWLFSDAPRRLRVEAVDHLPKLIQKLTEEAKVTALQLKGKIAAAQQVVEAVAGPNATRQQ